LPYHILKIIAVQRSTRGDETGKKRERNRRAEQGEARREGSTGYISLRRRAQGGLKEGAVKRWKREGSESHKARLGSGTVASKGQKSLILCFRQTFLLGLIERKRLKKIAHNREEPKAPQPKK